MRQGVRVQRVSADTWRQALLPASARRTALEAKRGTAALARRIIAWAGAPEPATLRQDAAAAILIGLWAAQQLGWLAVLPAAVVPIRRVGGAARRCT